MLDILNPSLCKCTRFSTKEAAVVAVWLWRCCGTVVVNIVIIRCLLFQMCCSLHVAISMCINSSLTAIVTRPPVRPSVRLSVSLWRWCTVRVCWVSSKVIKRIISVGFRCSNSQPRKSIDLVQGIFRVEYWDAVAVLSRKPAISLKWNNGEQR